MRRNAVRILAIGALLVAIGTVPPAAPGLAGGGQGITPADVFRRLQENQCGYLFDLDDGLYHYGERERNGILTTETSSKISRSWKKCSDFGTLYRSIDVSDVTQREGTLAEASEPGFTNFVFEVSLSSAGVDQVNNPTRARLRYTIQPDGATANADYVDTTGEITLSKDNLSETIVIKVVADAVPEGAEQFVVQLVIQEKTSDIYPVLEGGVEINHSDLDGTGVIQNDD